MRQDIRNIAIIAHVDHGKTTLVDALLKQSENFKTKAEEGADLILDNNDLERERGITILSKNVSINYKGVKINIVDTPGHADFGGEVERIMRMVDGVLILVDAKEGPMPQTKFVLKKAIEAGHKPSARSHWVLNEAFNLFVDLGATDEQAEFPTIYAAGLQGKAGLTDDLATMKDVTPLFETIIKYFKPAEGDVNAPAQFLTVNLAQDSYKGKIAIGRLYAGTLKKGQQVMHINREGVMKKASITSLMVFSELARKEVDEVYAGDIVAIAGIEDVSIGETIADIDNPKQLPPIHVDEPTLKAIFYVNKSPFAGKEGEYVTSRNIKERLFKEVETDVALRVDETNDADRWVVSGRGELHLSILIEKMRREGFEFAVGRPQVIFKEEGGQKLEPIELVAIEVPNEYVGAIMQNMGSRMGQLREMRPDGNITKLEFLIPTRGLIGYRNDFMTNTKGEGIMNALFFGYELFKGESTSAAHGSLVAHETGKSTNYGLMAAQERGHMFIGPGVDVYQGMVVGKNAKELDMVVNVCREKQLSNMRAKSDGGMEFLDVPLALTLEDSLEYISDDEIVEVTPKSIRIRKMDLKKAAK